jgi:hypothetical protein
VTSIVRALGLGGQCYDRLLDFFHSKAVDPDALCRCWVKTVFARMPGIHRVNGRPVLLGDGLKIPKRGRKMPAVKLLHQVSDCHTKPEYIMGHSLQVVSVLPAHRLPKSWRHSCNFARSVRTSGIRSSPSSLPHSPGAW